MSELLIEPLIFGLGMAYIGLAPGAVYPMYPGGDPDRKVMTTLYAASAVTSTAAIHVQADSSKQDGG
jgi:hypothetical protein